MNRIRVGLVAAFMLSTIVGMISLPSQAQTVTGFSDVPSSHPFSTAIRWLSSEGITRGCNPPSNTRFCPDARVTRGQMAVFLSRAFGYSDRGTVDFVDDDGHMFEPYIEMLATAGVTRGCNPPANDRFCPDAYVTRGQMAVFLSRAFGYTDRGTVDFVDDGGNQFEPYIEMLATAGVTRGCNPPSNDRFCPNDYVTRGQMAAFLHRGFGSPIPPPLPSSEGFTADHTYVERYDLIPTDVVDRVSDLNIYYGHTSHGSQLVTGVETMPSAWQLNNLYETAPDLGTSTWNIQTDTWLSAHPETEVVVWSWCGQQSSNSVATVQAYLDKMSALEAKYQNVTFIYMTGHLRGAYEYFYEDAENMVLQRNNQMVRDYAEANGKWLFDFADIESYLDGSSTQCMYHGMPVECTWPNDAYGCAHSRMGNCDRKGKAFYVLLAEIVGWDS